MKQTWIPAFAGMTMVFSAVAKEVAVDVGHYAAEPGVISASGRPEFEYNLAPRSGRKGGTGKTSAAEPV